jgi:hypothetical protein
LKPALCSVPHPRRHPTAPCSKRLLALEQSNSGFGILVDSFFTGARDDIPCENSQHTSRASSSFSYPYVQEDNVVLRYSFMKLTFLLEHLKLKGNLSSALEKHVFFFAIKEKMDQIIISKEVSKYAKDNLVHCIDQFQNMKKKF